MPMPPAKAAFGQTLSTITTPGCNPSIDDIRGFVGEALAKFKVPTYVEFRESMPYSATGKLLKRELEEEERAVSTQ